MFNINTQLSPSLHNNAICGNVRSKNVALPLPHVLRSKDRVFEIHWTWYSSLLVYTRITESILNGKIYQCTYCAENERITFRLLQSFAGETEHDMTKINYNLRQAKQYCTIPCVALRHSSSFLYHLQNRRVFFKYKHFLIYSSSIPWNK